MSIIYVIGLGAAEQVKLTIEAEQALFDSQIVIGSSRQLTTIKGYLDRNGINIELMALPKLDRLKQFLRETQGRNVALLASGDPLFYGIGKWAAQAFPDRVVFFPAVSSIQAACHYLGVALQDVNVISLHGRPISLFRQQVRNNRQYLFLTDHINNPAMIAAELIAGGFETSELWILERLGYSNQRVRSFEPQTLLNQTIQYDELNIVYVKTQGQGGVYPEFPGVQDQLFITCADSTGKIPSSNQQMITKKEIRLSILSALQTPSGSVCWDVGAGCGGLATEWGIFAQAASIYAIEQNPERYGCILQNKAYFGVENLQPILGAAPEALLDLPSPDRVFIGGSDGELTELIQYCWQHLNPMGKLVVTAVTENSKWQMHQALQSIQPQEADMIEIAIKRKSLIGTSEILRPQLPVQIMTLVKGCE